MDDLFSEYFATSRVIPVQAANLGAAAEDLMDHFRIQGYDVAATQLGSGGYFVSISKGDWFRALLGMKTALNVRIEPGYEGVNVRASIGIFELQLLPTIITAFVFAPVILGQIWGIVQQNKLDEEAVQVVERSLATRGGTYAAPAPGAGGPQRPAPDPSCIIF